MHNIFVFFGPSRRSCPHQDRRVSEAMTRFMDELDDKAEPVWNKRFAGSMFSVNKIGWF